MVRKFGDVRAGVFVWTRDCAGAYRLGRITGPLREDRSRAGRTVGIRYVRTTDWLQDAVAADNVPLAVVKTFARGGRNFQRTHDVEAERQTAELWASRRNTP